MDACSAVRGRRGAPARATGYRTRYVYHVPSIPDRGTDYHVCRSVPCNTQPASLSRTSFGNFSLFWGLLDGEQEHLTRSKTNTTRRMPAILTCEPPATAPAKALTYDARARAPHRDGYTPARMHVSRAKRCEALGKLNTSKARGGRNYRQRCFATSAAKSCGSHRLALRARDECRTCG